MTVAPPYPGRTPTMDIMYRDLYGRVSGLEGGVATIDSGSGIPNPVVRLKPDTPILTAKALVTPLNDLAELPNADPPVVPRPRALVTLPGPFIILDVTAVLVKLFAPPLETAAFQLVVGVSNKIFGSIDSIGDPGVVIPDRRSTLWAYFSQSFNHMSDYQALDSDGRPGVYKDPGQPVSMVETDLHGFFPSNPTHPIGALHGFGGSISAGYMSVLGNGGIPPIEYQGLVANQEGDILVTVRYVSAVSDIDPISMGNMSGQAILVMEDP